MDAKGIRHGLNEVQEAKEALAETERNVGMGTVYIEVEGSLYAVDHITQMIQRDEITVVCPIIVAGRRL